MNTLAELAADQAAGRAIPQIAGYGVWTRRFQHTHGRLELLQINDDRVTTYWYAYLLEQE